MSHPFGLPVIDAGEMTEALKPSMGRSQSLPIRLTEDEVAFHWRLTKRTLQRWRCSGKGPAWMRIGGRILYRREDVLAYEASVLTGPAA